MEQMIIDNYRAIEVLEDLRNGAEDNQHMPDMGEYLAALQVGIDAVKKQIPEKPRIIPRTGAPFIWQYYCPVCGEYYGSRGEHNIILFEKKLYCDCGQAIDWTED